MVQETQLQAVSALTCCKYSDRSHGFKCEACRKACMRASRARRGKRPSSGSVGFRVVSEAASGPPLCEGEARHRMTPKEEAVMHYKAVLKERYFSRERRYSDID